MSRRRRCSRLIFSSLDDVRQHYVPKQRAWRVSGWGFHPQPSRYAEMFHVKHAPGAPRNQRTPNTRICNANNVRVSFCMGVGFSISRNPA